MAIISTLIGGVSGFFTFLSAMLFFDAGFLVAAGLYAGVGTTTAMLLILATTISQKTGALHRMQTVISARPSPAHSVSR